VNAITARSGTALGPTSSLLAPVTVLTQTSPEHILGEIKRRILRQSARRRLCNIEHIGDGSIGGHGRKAARQREEKKG
jgi:hypothetical protein